MNKIISQHEADTVICPKYGLPGNTKKDHVLKWDAILEVMSTLPKGKVLDIGCGQHDFPLLLDNLGFEVLCVEKDRISNNVRNSKVSCHIGDAFEYLKNLEDNSLDYVTDGCSIIHFNTNFVYAPNDGCQEISELLLKKLKPGGKLIIVCDFLKTSFREEYNNGEFLYLHSLITSFQLGGLKLVGEMPEIIKDPYSFEYNGINLCICRLVFQNENKI